MHFCGAARSDKVREVAFERHASCKGLLISNIDEQAYTQQEEACKNFDWGLILRSWTEVILASTRPGEEQLIYCKGLNRSRGKHAQNWTDIVAPYGNNGAPYGNHGGHTLRK